MVSELGNTPKALRLHIGIFGAANAGKSTLINAVTGQDIALVSEVAGTTTDPVFKPMELLPLGPVVFIDTAGFDDEGELGKLRMQKTVAQIDSCDAAIFVISSKEEDISHAKKNLLKITKANIPFIVVVNAINGDFPSFDFSDMGITPIIADLHKSDDAAAIRNALIDLLKDKVEEPVLTANLVKRGDTVILVAPQDIQAPKGRLILPQVQVTRDLLDNGCIVVTVTAENLGAALKNLASPPALVITDSQIFKAVNEIVPKEIPLTSFSLLMAKIKGDISELVHGAEVIDTLSDGDKIAIMESCSHHSLDGDIAKVKLPALVRKYTGKSLEIVNFSGQNIPEDLSEYKLIIHCGGCMVNRKAFLAKQKKYRDMGVPMTNFGVAIAYMNGILKRITY